MDFYDQSHANCHDAGWVKRVAPQLVDKVVTEIGLAREEVRAELNGIWSKIGELGLSGYQARLYYEYEA